MSGAPTTSHPSSARPVLIAGGGIGGMATALTLHQIGVPCIVFETVPELQPLGVGINLQPNAVRELHDLGFGNDVLDTIGLQAREWALVGRNGNEVYAEPRGLEAGYHWPQYSVHRGQLQMMLYHAVKARLGDNAVQLGQRVVGYRQDANGVTAIVETRDGTQREVAGSLLIAADGLHSAVRAQMHPTQPPIQWGGAIMWRGTTPGVPVRTGASFVGVGSLRHRVVFYPITPPDPVTGLATINWIAEITVDNQGGWQHGDWNRRVALEEFIHHFDGWNYSWLDVPAMLRGAKDIFEYPMIDRDPVPTWVDGRVALLGDAAHVMYPVGSNGASQAIVDAQSAGRPAHCAWRGPAGAARLRRQAVQGHLRAGAAQPGFWPVWPAGAGGRALRWGVRPHRRRAAARGARGLHGPLQGGGGVCHRDAERGAAHHCARAASDRWLNSPRRCRAGHSVRSEALA